MADIFEQKTRQIVIDRENRRCLICNRTGQDVHEIIPRSKFGKLTMNQCFAEKNRTLLCRQCHNFAHTIQMRAKLLEIMQQKHGYVYTEAVYQKYLT